jgi:predicted nucleic acid-binding protein
MHMKRVVLDTDVSSRSIKDKLPPSLRTRLGAAQFSITFVTLGELTQWATFRDWGPRNRATFGDGWQPRPYSRTTKT